jgi:hypothetical protein
MHGDVRGDDENVIRTGTLMPNGTLSNVRYLRREDILACPWVIMASEHYREDGTCKCDDPTAKEMREWGYVWNTQTKRWEDGVDLG